MLKALERLRADPGREEVMLRENYGRDGENIILDMAARLGLHAKKYGTGRNTALAVSKRPLPNYRADLDNREREFELEMSSRQQRIVEDALDELQTAPLSETDPAQLRRRGREMLAALPVEDHRPPQKRRGGKADVDPAVHEAQSKKLKARQEQAR